MTLKIDLTNDAPITPEMAASVREALGGERRSEVRRRDRDGGRRAIDRQQPTSAEIDLAVRRCAEEERSFDAQPPSPPSEAELREALEAIKGEAHAIASGAPEEEHIADYQAMAATIFHTASWLLRRAAGRILNVTEPVAGVLNSLTLPEGAYKAAVAASGAGEHPAVLTTSPSQAAQKQRDTQKKTKQEDK